MTDWQIVAALIAYAIVVITAVVVWLRFVNLDDRDNNHRESIDDYASRRRKEDAMQQRIQKEADSMAARRQRARARLSAVDRCPPHLPVPDPDDTEGVICMHCRQPLSADDVT